MVRMNKIKRIILYISLMSIIESIAIISAYSGYSSSGICINSGGYSHNSIPVIIAYNFMLPLGDLMFAIFYLPGILSALALGFLGWFIIFAVIGETVDWLIGKARKLTSQKPKNQITSP
jgi:hypothetical protein